MSRNHNHREKMIFLLILIPILAGAAVWFLADKKSPAHAIDCAKQDCIDCPIGPNCEHYRRLMGIEK